MKFTGFTPKAVDKDVSGQDNVISNPRIYVAVMMVIFPLILIFYRPSLFEFLGFCLVDALAFIIASRYEMRIFHYRYPKTKVFFPDLRPEIEQVQSLADRLSLYSEIQALPRRRSIHYLIMSSIKVIPSFIYIVLVWGGDGQGLLAFVKALLIGCFTFSFATGASYLAYHQRMSQLLCEIHDRFDWSEVFRQGATELKAEVWTRVELIASTSIFTCFFCIASIVVADRSGPVWVSIGTILFAGLATTYFLYQILKSSRSQTMEGIETLVTRQTESVGNFDAKSLALSTNPQLAYYQRAINNLVEQVVQSEREASLWMLKMVEDSRYRDLGEATALLIHDQLTPITAMQYCTEILSDKFPDLERDHHFQILLDAMARQQALVTNLRSSIRGEKEDMTGADISLANEAAKSLTRYKNFNKPYFSQIRFQSDLPADLRLGISQIELNQILTNLFTNSADNLIVNSVDKPVISIRVDEAQDLERDFVTLKISDNGTGLSKARFRSLTEGVGKGEGGAGLMLTHKLVQRRGGRLDVAEKADQGTEFLLRLKRSNRVQPASIGSYVMN